MFMVRATRWLSSIVFAPLLASLSALLRTVRVGTSLRTPGGRWKVRYQCVAARCPYGGAAHPGPGWVAATPALQSSVGNPCRGMIHILTRQREKSPLAGG